MKIYDKAQWHIDAGEAKEEVIAKLRIVFQLLNEWGLLSEEGQEIFEFGIDSSTSLNERLLTDNGVAFLDTSYDAIINFDSDVIGPEFEKFYTAYKGAN